MPTKKVIEGKRNYGKVLMKHGFLALVVIVACYYFGQPFVMIYTYIIITQALLIIGEGLDYYMYGRRGLLKDVHNWFKDLF